MIDRAYYSEMFEDPDFGRLTSLERIFYLGCISCQDRSGKVTADARYLRHKLYGYDNISVQQVAAIRDSVLEKFPKVWLEEVDGKLYIRVINYGGQAPRQRLSAGRLEWHRIAFTTRPRIFARDNYQCRICGATAPLEVDHVTPIAKGGTNDDDNLQTLCKPCNRRKWAH